MLNYTLKELAAELAAKRASSVEVTQFFLNRINTLGKTLNAFISVDNERSLAGARAADALRAKGLADETIAAAFQAAGADGAADIERVWKSRFSTLPENNRELARQVRFLQGRGFSLDDTLKFLRTKP